MDSQLKVVNLYRASSKQQTEKIKKDNGMTEYDVPSQRDILIPFVEQHPDWTLIKEFVEGGVSGFKVSANDRDALVEIKKMAARKEFDILVIYMSDRLGRIADETPLVVSFLNSHGIKVISYTEGEIKADTHADKLMTYIRYWQAEGESLKTSMRVTDAGERNVRQGKWRGGNPPYGYHSVSRGTLNYKGKPIFDVEIHPETSETVKTVFRMYGTENYGGKGIAKYLNDKGIPSAEGGHWNCSLIIKMLKNRLYTGVYELGRVRKSRTLVLSPVMENLVIIPEREFNEVQAIMKKHTKNPDKTAQRQTRHGKLLLTGFLYCGECGRKFTSHQYKTQKARQDGSLWKYHSVRYRCGSYHVPMERQGPCHQKVYKAADVEATVIDDAKKFILTLDKDKLMRSHEDELRGQEKDITERLKKAMREIAQKEKEVQKLKDEVIKVLMGESQFPQSLLSGMIQTKEAELIGLREKREAAQAAADGLAADIAERKAVCAEIDGWPERFDRESAANKKSMLLNILDRVVVKGNKFTSVYKVKMGYAGGDSTPPPANGENTGLLSAHSCVKGYLPAIATIPQYTRRS
jgi:DNA invertase Pin-like site-specific DNA recombinase